MSQILVPSTRSISSLPPKDQISQKQKESFHKHKFELGHIKAGTRLWRFYSGDPTRRISDCWIDENTMEAIRILFRDSAAWQLSQKKVIIRENLGILVDWNLVSHRIRIQFKKIFLPTKE